MPRIEYIPDDFDESKGDGSPTIDVCRKCAKHFQEGEPMPPDLDGEAMVGSTDVEHPPFDECDYSCDICGKQLVAVDD